MAYAILALIKLIEELMYGRQSKPKDDDDAPGSRLADGTNSVRYWR